MTLSKKRRWAALIVLSASLFVITMDMTILNIAIPEMAGELHPTSDQQLWIVDVYSLVLAGLLVSVAAIADRWGRKRMLILGYAIFGLASMLVLIAHNAETVIVIRALLGVGGAMIMPTTLSLIRVIFYDLKERATALSIWAAVSGLGAVIGPLVGGFLLEHFSWHAAFLVNVPLMAVGVVASIILLPESRVKNPGKWDALAAAASLIGMVALIWAIKQFGKEASFAVPSAWAATVIASLALTWFVRRNLKSKHPLLDLRLFKNRQFAAGIIAAVGATFSMIAALLLIAQWLQLVAGHTPIEAGIQLMPMAVIGAVAALLAPGLSSKIGPRTVLAGGILFAAAGLFLLGLKLTMPLMLIVLSLVGVGMGAFAIGSALIMGGVSEDKAGNAGALEETAYEFGATLGVAILGSVSAIIYRANLTVSESYQTLEMLDPTVAQQARDSLGAAIAISDEIIGQPLAESAAEAFTHSLQFSGVVGGIIMLAVAALVFFITPRGTRIN